MSTIPQDLTPLEASLAYDANNIAQCKLFSHLPQTIFYDDPGILWYTTGSPMDGFNGVLQTQLEPESTSGAIEHVYGYFQQQHLLFLWFVGPSSRPANLGQILEEHGLAHVETEPIMALDLRKMHTDIPVSSRLVIHPVTTPEQLLQWIRVWLFVCPEELIQQCFALYSGLDLYSQGPIRLYLGTIDGEPVATSDLFLGEEAASVGHVVTLSDYRGQGIGGSMTLAPLQEAQKSGYTTGVLSASPMGISIYRRIGFQECGTFSVYGKES